MHNPSIIPTTLDLEFYRIFPNRSYDFRFNKHIAYLKPPPFKTNCRDYYRSNPKGCKKELILFNIQKIHFLGLKSRGDCINNCIKSETFGIYNCANYYGIITKDLLLPEEKICQKKSQNYFNYTNARRKCLKDCQLSCIEESYELYAQEFSSPNTNDAIIEIRSDSIPYTYIYHKEALGQEEFIGKVLPILQML